MFLPYSDDAPREGRTPWMNWVLIAINVWAFVAFALRPDYQETVERFGFTPGNFDPMTLLTAMFLHANVAHIAGNMWFLHIFGDSVETRCGPFKYLICYLAAGILGSLCQYAFFPGSQIPSIGASGAIAGVMGMSLFFFPTARVKIFYFIFLFIGTTSVRALWVIGVWFVIELLASHMQTLAHVESGVGHLAHTGGFVAGLVFAMLLTYLRIVRDDGQNLFAYLTGSASPQRESNSGYGTQQIADEQPAAARFRMLREDRSDPRTAIIALLHAGRTDEARRAWRKYAFDNHDGVLPPREQLEIALALDKQGERSAARDAYERLIHNYPNEQPFAAEANLALAGMLLAELKENGDSREVPFIESLLRRAANSHPSSARRQLAERWLEMLESSFG